MAVSFVTLFLGLTLGIHPITLAVAPDVASVELLLDGRVAGVAGPDGTWRVKIDFGDELAPRELVAVAYDAAGDELGRTRQPINLPRAPAEAEVMIEGAGTGEGAVARVFWESVKPPEPRSVTATFDGEPLPVSDPRRIELPPHDPEGLHFLSVHLEFSDTVAATAEASFGGTYGDTTRTELTAVSVEVEAGAPEPTPERLAGWLATADGDALTPVGVEAGPAEIVVVLDREAQPALWEVARRQLLFQAQRSLGGENRYRRALRKTEGSERPETSFWRREMLLHENQTLRLLWPYPERIEREGATFELFPRSEDHPREHGGVFWLLCELEAPDFPVADQRLSDAAALAGLTATGRGRRRAVVLVLTPKPQDASRLDPGVVRRYLARLGVPLEVWVVGRPGRAMRQAWGDAVRSVDTTEALGRAVEDLARRLDRQRIVWVEGRHLPQEVELTGRARGLRMVR